MESDESTNEQGLELFRSRPWHAYHLKLAGLSLSEIADRLNYTSGAEVARVIKNETISAAKDIEPEERESLLDLEVERLNYAQSKIWVGVEAGDIKCIEALLKIIQLRTKLQGLDMVDASAGVQTVLVVGGQEADYVNKLKLVAGDD